jgi:hypothetical protein
MKECSRRTIDCNNIILYLRSPEPAIRVSSYNIPRAVNSAIINESLTLEI